MYERDAYRSASFCERDLALSRQNRNVRPSERSQKRDRRTGSSSSYLTLRRERARTRPSLYAIDRYLLDNGAVHGALIPVGTWHLEHVRNRCYGPGGPRILRTKLQSAADGITSRYYERTRNCDTRIYFSSFLLSKKPSTSFPVTLMYARNVISLWTSPRVFSRHPLRVRVFIQRLRQIFCLVELHRGQNISVPAHFMRKSL